MTAEMKAANALGAKTARACDSCLRSRARWFCGADDAFLCHACDTLVHSANQLASRHERVRLQTASCKVTAQSWHSGFTRKARTPRHNKHLLGQQHKHEELEEEDLLLDRSNCVLPLVPELGSEEPMLEETEEQLLCRVPVFDPFDAGICGLYREMGEERLDLSTMKKESVHGDEETCDLDNLSEFLPSDMDLAEFAADVESLLESRLDEDSGEVKDSEQFDCKEEEREEDVGIHFRTRAEYAMVKVKDEGVEAVPACDHLDSVLDMEGLSWNIESETLDDVLQEKEAKVAVLTAKNDDDSVGKLGTKRKIFLRLNYEDVISAWASQGSPWTTGNQPQFVSSDFWPQCLGSSGADVQQCYGEVGSLREHVNGDGGREARVSRYREKRRTRLFAKKIRYEVRKLNAEKRPRLKGRFVKRSSLVGTASAFLTTDINHAPNFQVC
ncbi:hypothetical protein L6164_008013 [Bauhinia variegata]|uniref:Uncharacterized protein n=1 Tax=Bauhinia variegata TaxID=167791 RepID=A0ACB9PFD2_BAUVA|nr:hypothetical protein L6164_008013 [Bauhinia variegata]